MAKLEITQHAIATGGHLSSLGLLGGHSAWDGLDIGGEAHTIAYPNYTVVRLMPLANCRIKIGVDAIATSTDGEYLPSGIEVARYVKQGERISVISA